MAEISKITTTENETYDLKDNFSRRHLSHYIIGNSTNASTNPSYAAVTSSPYYGTRWCGDDSSITEYYDGLQVTFRVPVAGNTDRGTLLNINGLGEHPVVYDVNTAIGQRYPVGGVVILHYNATQTATCYRNAASSTTVTGVWQVQDYNSDAGNYNVRDLYLRPYVGTTVHRYKLCGIGADNRLQPITITDQTSSTRITNKQTNTVPIKGSAGLYFYVGSSSITANNAISSQTLYRQYSSSSYASYNFNGQLPAYRVIYIKGTYDLATDMFTIVNSNNTNWYVSVPNNTASINLSDYFTQGEYYMLAGYTYSSADYFSLDTNNKIFYFDGTNLTLPINKTLGDIATLLHNI